MNSKRIRSRLNSKVASGPLSSPFNEITIGGYRRRGLFANESEAI